jgi:DNA-binding Xre family transcriptional regulator
MAASHNKLFKLRIDRTMVSCDVLAKICTAFECTYGYLKSLEIEEI